MKWTGRRDTSQRMLHLRCTDPFKIALDLIDELTSAGADVNQKDRTGAIPLSYWPAESFPAFGPGSRSELTFSNNRSTALRNVLYCLVNDRTDLNVQHVMDLHLELGNFYWRWLPDSGRTVRQLFPGAQIHTGQTDDAWTKWTSSFDDELKTKAVQRTDKLKKKAVHSTADRDLH